LERAVESVGGELGGVALGGGEAADGGIDGVDVDQGGIEDRLTIDHLGDGGSGGLGCSAALGIDGDGLDSAVGNREGDPREIAAGRAARGAGESVVDYRPSPALVTQVVLE
jgi:hypothetical protein